MRIRNYKFRIAGGVQEQLTKYSGSLLKGGDKLKNTQLMHRKELMEKILELW